MMTSQTWNLLWTTLVLLISSLGLADADYDGFAYTEPNSYPSVVTNAETSIPCGHSQQAGLFDQTTIQEAEGDLQKHRGLANEQSPSPAEEDPLAFDPCR